MTIRYELNSKVKQLLLCKGSHYMTQSKLSETFECCVIVSDSMVLRAVLTQGPNGKSHKGEPGQTKNDTTAIWNSPDQGKTGFPSSGSLSSTRMKWKIVGRSGWGSNQNDLEFCHTFQLITRGPAPIILIHNPLNFCRCCYQCSTLMSCN